MLHYGRFLLDRIFQGDATDALDERTKNPVWNELVRRAGGPTLAISRHTLYVVIRIAANDKRIMDRAWQGLDMGRKELLLPLGEDKLLRQAAQHVSRFNLTQAKTKEYVAAILKTENNPPAVRLTQSSLTGRIKKARDSLSNATMLPKIRELGAKLDPKARDAVIADLESLRESLLRVVKALRAR